MRTLIYATYFSACCGRATRGFRVDTFANESSIDFPWRMARTFDRGEFSMMIDGTRRCTLQQFFDGIWFLRSNVKFSAAIKFSMDFSFREEWLRGYLFRNVIGKDDFPPLIRVSSMCYFLRENDIQSDIFNTALKSKKNFSKFKNSRVIYVT